MRRIRLTALPLVLVLLALALAAAGCGGGDSGGGGGGGDGAPAANDLAADAFAAMEEQQAARFVLDALFDVEASGQVGDPTLQQFAENPPKIHVEGAASEEALNAEGSVDFAGQTFRAMVLAGESEAYVNFLGEWYGTTQFGLGDAKDQAGGAEDDPDAQRLQEKFGSPEGVRENFDQILTGEVTEGPEADGTETWQFEGTLNVDGIQELAKEEGEEMEPEERDQLETIADAVTVTFLVGKEDDLVRRVELKLDISREDLETLSEDTQEIEGVEAMTGSFSVDFSDWGTEVAYDAPAQFKPIEQLLGALG